jgi:hypothetical protein
VIGLITADLLEKKQINPEKQKILLKMDRLKFLGFFLLNLHHRIHVNGTGGVIRRADENFVQFVASGVRFPL